MRECCGASPRSCPSTYPGTVPWPPRRWPPGPTVRGGRPPPLASRDGPQRRADAPARTRPVRPGAAADVLSVLAARHRPGGNRRGRRHTQVGVDHDRPQDAGIRAGIRGVPRGARRAGAQLLHRRAPHRARRRAHVSPLTLVMRFGWVGCHVEGLSALEALRSGAVDYAPLCVRYGIPLARVGNINEPDGLAALRTLDADVVFVIGWSQILRPAALQLARTGMIGAHASLLPQLRGSAPINWALIRSERQTGNSLIWLAQDVDRGAIIDQTAFCITPYDTCASLYERVAASNRDMLLRLVPRLLAGEHPGRVQPAGDEPVLPRRRPADGRIDWRQPS